MKLKQVMQNLGIVLAFFALCGCYDAEEPNDIAYVVALGVDESDSEGVYEYTIQFAKTTQISGGSSESGGKEGSDIIENINVKAPTIYSGINMANQVISKSFTLAHTKLIVISEEVAKKGVEDLFDTFGRNSDIRPNIYLSVSKGKAKDYLKAVKPVAEVNPVTYYRLIYRSEYGGYVPKSVLQDFYFQLDGAEKQNVLPLAGVNQKSAKKEDKKSEGGEESGGSDSSSGEASSEESSSGSSSGGSSSSDSGNSSGSGQEQQSQKQNQPKPQVNKSGFDYLTKKYIAGNIDVEKENSSEVIGMAVFKGDKMIGQMDDIESLIYNIVTGEFNISYTSFYNEANPQTPITVSLETKRAPQISVKTKEDVPKIKLRVYLEGQLMSEAINNPVEEDISKIEKQLEAQIKEEIERFLKKTQKELDSDIVGFGQKAKINFLDYNKYLEYDWNSKYKLAEFEVSVDFDIRRIGFIDLSKPER